MPPIRNLADNLRQLPLRNISRKILDIREGGETLAMIGIRKPSLHFYSKQIVFYEANSEQGLINLSERFMLDKRESYFDKPNYEYDSFLLVIDQYSSDKEHWSSINHKKLGNYGIYDLWRVKKNDLNKAANNLIKKGVKASWQNINVEKF